MQSWGGGGGAKPAVKQPSWCQGISLAVYLIQSSRGAKQQSSSSWFIILVSWFMLHVSRFMIHDSCFMFHDSCFMIHASWFRARAWILEIFFSWATATPIFPVSFCWALRLIWGQHRKSRYLIPKWLDRTKTYYLLYKSYVFRVPKPPKYRYFGTQKHHKSS